MFAERCWLLICGILAEKTTKLVFNQCFHIWWVFPRIKSDNFVCDFACVTYKERMRFSSSPRKPYVSNTFKGPSLLHNKKTFPGTRRLKRWRKSGRKMLRHRSWVFVWWFSFDPPDIMLQWKTARFGKDVLEWSFLYWTSAGSLSSLVAWIFSSRWFVI